VTENSLFGKVEALIRKHRGTSTDSSDPARPPPRVAPSPDAWLPVLTDIIQRGSPPVVAPNVFGPHAGVAEPIQPDPVTSSPAAPSIVATPPSDHGHDTSEAPVERPDPTAVAQAQEPAVDIPTDATARPDPALEENETQADAPAGPVAAPAPERVVEGPAGTDPETRTTEDLVQELAPKITGLMQEQVAEELRRSLNQSMNSLMASLNANVEEIVRQAVTERLAQKDKKAN
jgi:hypothetical protein